MEGPTSSWGSRNRKHAQPFRNMMMMMMMMMKTINSEPTAAIVGYFLFKMQKVWWVLENAIFWAITLRLVVNPYRRFRTTYRSHFQGSMKTGPIRCPETSVRIYHYSLRNNPEERSSHLLRVESLEPRVIKGCDVQIARHTLWDRWFDFVYSMNVNTMGSKSLNSILWLKWQK